MLSFSSRARRGVFVVLLAAVFAGIFGATDLRAETIAFRQSVAEASAADAEIAEFYRVRGYQTLWTSAADAGRRQAFFRALAVASDHGLPTARYGAEGLRASFAAVASESQRGRLEVAMTRSFLSYARDVQTGFLQPAEIDPGIEREVPVRDPVATLNAFSAADPFVFIKALPPQEPQYAQLMKERLSLEAVIEGGGWGGAVPEGKLEPGAVGLAVMALRDRLVAQGYLRQTASPTFDEPLMRAVQAFQRDHGLTPDGIAGDGTIAEINAEPEARLRSVLVAMERMRWMNGLPLGQRHIWVNLPDFTAKIVDNSVVSFQTVTVVGMNQSDRRSPEFSDMMEFLVVNPTWNVPRSITVKEYLPMLQQDPNAAGHLRIVDRSGRQVDRAAVDFRQFTPGNFPFSMSQAPSDGNALGLVKFMFPNPHNIYLHDTPSKSLFQKESRAYSHGCIRLGDPFDFAYALLARQSDDPQGLFKAHLKTGKESTVPLEQPVPVHLVYFTAWPKPTGGIDYRRDVYGRDALIFEAMEQAGVVLRAVQG